MHFNVSRKEPGRVTFAWAVVQVWNPGGRPLAVESVGFRYFVTGEADGGTYVGERRASIALPEPIELSVDGPSRRATADLGPMIKAGIDPFSPVEAFAVTTGDREWFGPPQPLVHTLPPETTPERLIADLDRIAERSDLPPAVGPLIALNPETPFLPDADDTTFD